MRIRGALGRSLMIVLCGVMLVAACMDDDDDVADEIEGDVIGSPTAAAGLEEDIEEVSIEITDGELSEDGVVLIEERPSILRVQNNDDVAYVLRIDPLVVGSVIPAGDSTSIEFTTPVSNEYTGELLPETGDEPLDTMTVEVISPIGVPD